MNNDLYQLIRGLRAVRAFQDRPITDAHLHKILEAGRWTGSAKNLQRWAFIVVTEAAQREALAACGGFMTPVRNAPAAIALVEEPDGYEFDTGRVAQNMMLAAAAIGVASCPVTIHDDAAARPVLGLEPDQRSRYAIAIGYPADTSGTGRRSGGVAGGRKPLGEIAFRERYGSPLDLPSP